MAKKIVKEYAWLFIQIILMVLILGIVFDAATYFRHEWQFHYPGFSIFFNKNNPKSQLSLSDGFFDAGAILFLYGLYVCIREFIIRLNNTSKQREYNILICNKVTAFILSVYLPSYFFADI